MTFQSIPLLNILPFESAFYLHKIWLKGNKTISVCATNAKKKMAGKGYLSDDIFLNCKHLIKMKIMNKNHVYNCTKKTSM